MKGRFFGFIGFVKQILNGNVNRYKTCGFHFKWIIVFIVNGNYYICTHNQ